MHLEVFLDVTPLSADKPLTASQRTALPSSARPSNPRIMVLTPKIKAQQSSETSLIIYLSTRRDITEYLNL
jgi:hypothetical protein